MKKLCLLFVMMLGSIASMAQIHFFSGTLEEALNQSKSENKPVVLLFTMANG